MKDCKHHFVYLSHLYARFLPPEARFQLRGSNCHIKWCQDCGALCFECSVTGKVCIINPEAK